MSNLASIILDPVSDEGNWLITGAVGLTTIVAATTAYYYVRGPKDREHKFPKLRGIQFYHGWKFFQRRYDFLQSNFKRNSGKSFSFDLLQNHVIALAGSDARQVFYSDPYLSSTEGFKVFRANTPRIVDVKQAVESADEVKLNSINKKLNTLLNKMRLQDHVPLLLQDIIKKADGWVNHGRGGRIDPFTEFNNLIFVITTHLAACQDLARNETDIKKIEDLFFAIESSSTATSVFFSWFPSPAKKMKQQATTDLFTLIYTYVEKRRHAQPTSDAIDVLIADGETSQEIAEFVMGIFFAGTTSTGMIPAWTLIYLAIHSEWKEKCIEELRSLLSRHLDASTSSSTLFEKLSSIPLSVWEDELPILDACTRESHRILLGASIAFRRNIGDRVLKIDRKVVEQGDFLVYPMGDVHFNPEYYPEPQKYDPGRWLGIDPVSKDTRPFLGWGAGRHACTGIRVAKLEMKLILAVILTKFEYKLVHANGKFPNPLPVPNMNYQGVSQRRPLGPTCYFDLKETAK